MNKIGIPIIALLILALGTLGIKNSLATQNVEIGDTSENIKSNKSEELLAQSSLDPLIENRRLAVQAVMTNLSFEENRLESVSFKDQAQEDVDEVTNTAEYIVESGDTLVNIATAFEVEASELAEWNESVTLNSQLQINDAIEIETALDPETIQPEKLTWEKKEKVENEVDLSNSIMETNDTVSDDAAETLTVVATAYSRNQPALTNITAMGIDLRDNPQVIAVDPDFIPLGTRVFVEGYGEAIAGDTGSAINGNRVDLHMESMDESFTWGIQEVELTLLD